MTPKLRAGAWLLAVIAALVFGASQASASPFEDIPAGFADAMGMTTETAKVILASGAIVGVSLAMATLGAKPTPMLLTVVVMVGLFVSITYLPAWMLILAVLLVALWFASDIKEVFT